MTPRVGVVVVTFRSEGTIEGCLRSVPRDTKITVVDNDSGDRSAEIASSVGATVVRNSENRGFGAAANQGAEFGSEEFVLFLNADAQLSADCLDRLAAALDAHPDLVVVGPATIDSPRGPLRGYWPFPGARDTWKTGLALHRIGKPKTEADGFVVGTCMLVRRDWFVRLGGFDARFWLYGEDADFCWRVRERGGGSAVVEGAAIQHADAYSSKQLPASFEHFHRGAELFIDGHAGKWALVSHRCGLFVSAVIRGVAFVPVNRARSRWFFRLAARELRLMVQSPMTPAPLPPSDGAP